MSKLSGFVPRCNIGLRTTATTKKKETKKITPVHH
jgi:hypothetical protein